MSVVYQSSIHGLDIYFSYHLHQNTRNPTAILSITRRFIRLNHADLTAVNAIRLHITCVFFYSFIDFLFISPSENLHRSSDPKLHLTVHTIAKDVHGDLVGTNTLHVYLQGTCAWGPPSWSLKRWNGGRQPLFSLSDRGW